MRVIAGIAKGHKLFAPPGKEIRPTADRVKEALFSILAEKVPGSLVLDLFAGSGALGIEALSRGASQCIFVDSSRYSVEAIENNLKKTGFGSSSEVVFESVAKAIGKLVARGQRFDLIFLDPPYKIRLTELKGILETLSREKLIKPGGTIAWEHSTKISLSALNELKVKAEKKYGDTGLTFFAPA